MSTREEIVSGFYDQYDEDGRLRRTRHGQLEYYTTMTYIHRYAAKEYRVLEVGAGTGRYSIALAKEGMDVTAVELVESSDKAQRQRSVGNAGMRSRRNTGSGPRRKSGKKFLAAARGAEDRPVLRPFTFGSKLRRFCAFSPENT